MVPIRAHLSSSVEVLEPLLKEDEEEGECRHDQSVACVTKHHRKEEGERDDGVGCWGRRERGGGGERGRKREEKEGGGRKREEKEGGWRKKKGKGERRKGERGRKEEGAEM